MTEQKRSPWFNARTEPPVNGDADSMYEHRCLAESHHHWRKPKRMSASWIHWWKCSRCQWRGLLREAK